MCGIAGVLMKSGQPDEAILEMAATALRHRGPDDQGVFVSGSLGLAHTRLSIIDLATGHQPLHSSDEKIHLVANGEIYNFVELRDKYIQLNHEFISASDSELAIHCYQNLGIEGFKELNGMFAIALYDEQSQRLHLVRDRQGIKPLFFAELDDRVIFASEIKALLPMLPNPPDINPNALGQFLQNQFHSGRETIFKGISRVLAGECLVVERDLTIQYKQYWSATEIEPQTMDLEQALEVFQPLFQQVLTEHMRSDVPFGLFLSGGLDSGVLLAELSRLKAEPIKTFSVGYSGSTMKDELSQAEYLANHFGAEHVSIKIDRDQLLSRIVHSIWAADDLMRDYASLPTSILSEQAAKQVKVVFSGEGGDEAFAGYRRYRPTAERWLKSLVFGTGGFRTRGQWSQARAESIFSSKLLAHSAREPFVNAWNEASTQWSTMQRSQYVDLKTALPDNLFVKADRMMMGFGLEGRVPFADHRIIEFGLSLPDNLKIKGKVGKHIVREWAGDILPAEHLARPKKGFYVPVNEWLSGTFLEELSKKLKRNSAINQWFQMDGVMMLFENQKTKRDASREIWCLMQFAIWHRLFVECPGVVPGVNEDPLEWIS